MNMSLSSKHLSTVHALCVYVEQYPTLFSSLSHFARLIFAQFACAPLLLMISLICASACVYEAAFIHRILKFHDININKTRTWLCFLYLRWCYGTHGKRAHIIYNFSFVSFFREAKSCDFVWNCWLNYTFLFSISLVLACQIPVFFVTKKIVFAAETTRIEMNGNMCSLRFYKYEEPISAKHYVDWRETGGALCKKENDRLNT